MIFGIIRDGVRSAFVRIVRYIVFAIIALLIFYVIGVFTNKKAKAFAIMGIEGQPTMVESERKHEYSYNAGKYQEWYVTHFSSTYTINNDYDLVAFKIIRLNTTLQLSSYNSTELNGYYVQPDIHNGTIDYYGNLGLHLNMSNFYQIGNGTYLTVFGYMQTNEGNIACFTTADYDNYVFCPIHRGLQINQFWLELAIDVPDYNRLKIDYEVRGERTYFNYDNTTIVQSQQQTQQTITDSTTTTSQANATSSLNTISGQFNDVLNGWGGQWSSLTHVVLEPINTVLYAFDSSTTCTPITLTIPYLNDGQTITLPCMSSIYGQYFSGFITVFVMIIGGLYGYRTIMYILRTIKEVIDAENDKIEVIDL